MDGKRFFKCSIAVLALGSLYTLARKYQVVQQAKGPDGIMRYFHQPIYQVFWLFIGMSLAYPFKRISDYCERRKNKENSSDIKKTKSTYSPYIVIFPSACDVFATILDTTGLIYTHVSVHQMLKGFIVIFTFIVSILVLKRSYKKHHYLGIFLILAGSIQVGRSNIDSFSAISAPRPLLGNLLCITGQFLLSLMFVYEEYILKDYDIHVLEMVGWEGIWGALLSGIILLFTFCWPHTIVGCKDNFYYATVQMINNKDLFFGVMTASLVIGPFNYYGSMLTKIAGATARCTIDSLRMFTVWTICVIWSWEEIRYSQLIGYCIIFLGTLIYNDAFCNGSQVTLKPSLPTSANIDSNILIIKYQIRNLLRLLFPETLKKELKEESPSPSKDKFLKKEVYRYEECKDGNEKIEDMLDNLEKSIFCN